MSSQHSGALESNSVLKYVKSDAFVSSSIGMHFGNNLNIFFSDKNFLLLNVDMSNCAISKSKVAFNFWFGRKLITADWEFPSVSLARQKVICSVTNGDFIRLKYFVTSSI